MVCSLESGRMAVMARLLAAGSFSPIITEDVSQEKLAAQYIHRELREADEANLLDEEDMNVFGLKPMADPLYLVCCNACKKPVKASQYAAHAELCKSLNPTEESFLELDGGAGQKKPPRKERKKSLIAYANQATMAGEQERFESMDADDTAASEPCLDEQIGAACSFTEIKTFTDSDLHVAFFLLDTPIPRLHGPWNRSQIRHDLDTLIQKLLKN